MSSAFLCARAHIHIYWKFVSTVRGLGPLGFGITGLSFVNFQVEVG